MEGIAYDLKNPVKLITKSDFTVWQDWFARFADKIGFKHILETEAVSIENIVQVKEEGNKGKVPKKEAVEKLDEKVHPSLNKEWDSLNKEERKEAHTKWKEEQKPQEDDRIITPTPEEQGDVLIIEGKQGKSVVYDYTEQRLFGAAFIFVNKTTNKKKVMVTLGNAICCGII